MRVFIAEPVVDHCCLAVRAVRRQNGPEKTRDAGEIGAVALRDADQPLHPFRLINLGVIEKRLKQDIGSLLVPRVIELNFQRRSKTAHRSHHLHSQRLFQATKAIKHGSKRPPSTAPNTF